MGDKGKVKFLKKVKMVEYLSDEENGKSGSGNGNGNGEEDEDEEEMFNWEVEMRRRVKKFEEMRELEKKVEEL